VLRMLRMFRVLKLAQHMGEARVLLNALRASRAKISVFLFAVMTLVCIEGTVMYLLEGEDNPGFHNIPQSIYWAIVTITTVGYGDIVLPKQWRLFAPVEGLTGILMCGLSTAFFFVIVSKNILQRMDDKDSNFTA